MKSIKLLFYLLTGSINGPHMLYCFHKINIKLSSMHDKVWYDYAYKIILKISNKIK